MDFVFIWISGVKVPQVAVVFTDGGSQDKERTRREAQRLRNEAGMYEYV